MSLLLPPRSRLKPPTVIVVGTHRDKVWSCFLTLTRPLWSNVRILRNVWMMWYLAPFFFVLHLRSWKGWIEKLARAFRSSAEESKSSNPRWQDLKTRFNRINLLSAHSISCLSKGLTVVVLLTTLLFLLCCSAADISNIRKVLVQAGKNILKSAPPVPKSIAQMRQHLNVVKSTVNCFICV